ncbi:GTPase-activating protein S13 [Coniosporium apollinis]|uniref:Protein transport protein SEC13 n=1 Tax=Coniosporium apollinis TaxID=61459 RepID=A0ABQ9P3M3_9PEZI|nr:GTPase-activating protein S13 [Coniosporium apollinis]
MAQVIASSGHDDMIHDAVLDYYGRRLATCSSDKTIKIFEVEGDSHRLTETLKGHEGAVWCVSWAHPKYGNILASASYDGKVFIWREQSSQWQKVYEFALHTASVNLVSWAPHEAGCLLACASSDGNVSVLEFKDNSWSHQIFPAHGIGVNAVSWAPAIQPGSLTSAAQPGPGALRRFVTGGSDCDVKIWEFRSVPERSRSDEEWLMRYSPETNTYNCVSTLKGHSDWVRDVAWSPTILSKSYIASASQDKTVRIWTSTNPSLGDWKSTTLNFDAVAWRASWSLSGNVLAVSTGDNRVSLWKERLSGGWELIKTIEDGSNILPPQAVTRIPQTHISESSSKPEEPQDRQESVVGHVVHNTYNDLLQVFLAQRLVSRGRDFARGFWFALRNDPKLARLIKEIPSAETGDAVVQAVNQVLEERKAKSFDRFYDDVRIIPVTSSALTFDGDISQPKLYASVQSDQTVGRILPVRLAPSGGGQDQISTVRVRISHKWVDLEAWLSVLPPSRAGLDARRLGAQEYELQFRWWATNGKVFRLTDLPQELRDILLIHVLGSTIFLERIWHRRRRGLTFDKHGSVPYYSEEGHIELRTTAVEMLCLNRQVYIEALEAGLAGWRHTFKGFARPACVGSIIDLAPIISAASQPH